MPGFIAAAILPLVVNSPIFFLGPAAISAVAMGIGYAATAIGLYAIQSAFAPKPPKPEDGQQSFRQATPTRVALYGRGKLSGPWVFGETKAGRLHKVIALSSRQLSQLHEIWVDDKQVTLDANGWVQTPPALEDQIRIQTRLGLATETSYSLLTAAFPEWTTDHRGDGVASLYAEMTGVKAEKFAKVYPNGINTLFRVVADGSAVYDPTNSGQSINNTATWAYSDNAAAIIMDYLRHSDGMRVPLSLIATPLALEGWQQAVTDCRDQIALKDGGFEDRYRVWGIYRYEERPADVLRRFMTACNARLKPTPDGGLTIEVGKWREPTVTIDETCIVAFDGVGRGRDIMQTANTVFAQFTSAAHDFQSTDADPWTDDADVSERGEIATSVDFLCAPSHGQCRRLMKIEAHRANPEWVGTFVCNLKALPAFGERFVNLSYPAFGIEGTFEVLDFQFIFGEHSTLIGVSLQVQSASAAAYDWNAATEEGTAPAIDETETDDTLPVPTGFSATVIRKIVGGQPYPFARLSWATPPVDSLSVEARGKKTSESDWQPIATDPNTTTVESFLLEDGAQYEFQIRHLSLTGRPSEWTASAIVVATADPVAPGVVTSPSIAGGAGQVTFGWKAPNSANYYAARLYLNTVNDPLTATLMATEYGAANDTESRAVTGLTAGTYYGWIVAINASGVAAASVATGSGVVT